MTTYAELFAEVLMALNESPDGLDAEHCLATYDHSALISLERNGLLATFGTELFMDVIRFRSGKFQHPTKVIITGAGRDYLTEVTA